MYDDLTPCHLRLGEYSDYDRRDGTFLRAYPLREIPTPRYFSAESVCFDAIPWHSFWCRWRHSRWVEWSMAPWLMRGWIRDCQLCRWQRMVSFQQP